MSKTLVACLVTSALLSAAPAPARANCTEDGSGCPGLGAAVAGIIIAGMTEGSIAVGGIVTLAGGAHDLRHGRTHRGWRVANYVFAALNLAAGVAWGGVAAARISPGITLGFAVPHLAVGASDLGIAIAF